MDSFKINLLVSSKNLMTYHYYFFFINQINDSNLPLYFYYNDHFNYYFNDDLLYGFYHAFYDDPRKHFFHYDHFYDSFYTYARVLKNFLPFFNLTFF